jgi:hypothetical protein
MTTARLISLGIGVCLAEVLADLGADVGPVVVGHGGGGGVEGFEEFGFELGFVGEVFFDEGLDVVADGEVLSGGDLGLEVGGEVFGDFKVGCDLHGGGFLWVDCFECSGFGLGWWVSGWGFVVVVDMFNDFDFGGVGELVDGICWS